MLDKAYAVIMAGGKGERFWPLSTVRTPKQLLSIVGDRPLIAGTFRHLAGLIPPERVIVITSADIVRQTRDALPEVPADNVIGEPFGRDTAAACALGAAVVKSRCPDGAFCVLTADHVIEDGELFRTTLAESFALATSHPVLVTMGIRPTFPSTGFGYIEAGVRLDHGGTVEFQEVRRFVEKPDVKTAEHYLASGRYYWNSGMFIWSVDTFLAALREYCPELHAMAKRLEPWVGKPEFHARMEEEYGKLGRISIDYAVMEKARNIITAKATFRWDDVGSWPALANHLPPDAAGNVVVGACETIDSTGNIVVSRGRLTALIGVKDLVVVQAEGATLICPRDRAQEVKKMVRQIADRGGHDHLL